MAAASPVYSHFPGAPGSTEGHHEGNNSRNSNTHNNGALRTPASLHYNNSTSQQQQLQRSPMFHHHHHHHHHTSSSSAQWRSPAQRSHGDHHRLPPSYSDLLRTPITSTQSVTTSPYHHSNNSNPTTTAATAAGAVNDAMLSAPLPRAMATPSFSPLSSPPLYVRSSAPVGRYRSSLPVPPPLRTLTALDVASPDAPTAVITSASADPCASAGAAVVPRGPRSYLSTPTTQRTLQPEPSARPEPRTSLLLRRNLPPPLNVSSVGQHLRTNSNTSNGGMHANYHNATTRGSTQNTSAHAGTSSSNTNHNSSVNGQAQISATRMMTRDVKDSVATTEKNNNSNSHHPPEDPDSVDGLSTPVDQRIPAMVPPSYDTYNLDGPAQGIVLPRNAHTRRSYDGQHHTTAAAARGRGGGRTAAGAAAAAGAQGRHPYFSMYTSVVKMPNKQQQQQQQLQHYVDERAAERKDEAASTCHPDADGPVVAMNEEEEEESRRAGMAGAASAPLDMCGSPHNQSTATDHYPYRTPQRAAPHNRIAPSSPAHRPRDASHEQLRPGNRSVVGGGGDGSLGGPAGCLTTPPLTEWCSPSTAGRVWHRVLSSSYSAVTSSSSPTSPSPSSALHSSEDVIFAHGGSHRAGLMMVMPQPDFFTATTPFSTPARAQPAANAEERCEFDLHLKQQQQQQLWASSSRDVTVSYGQSSTPRDIDLMAPHEGQSRSATQASALLVTPNFVASVPANLYHHQQPQQQQQQQQQHESRAYAQVHGDAIPTTSEWNRSASTPLRDASTATAAGNPAISLTPSLAAAAAAVAATTTTFTPATSARVEGSRSAHLRYARNSDFLFAVDEDDVGAGHDGEYADGLEMSDLPEAAAMALHSPTTDTPSVYCSPQQFPAHDHAYWTSATTTPASTAAAAAAAGVAPSTKVSRVNSGSAPHVVATPLSRNWPEALFASPPRMRTASTVHGNDGWRSPLQWNPRQARDDLEMLAAQEVAEFALRQHLCSSRGGATTDAKDKEIEELRRLGGDGMDDDDNDDDDSGHVLRQTSSSSHAAGDNARALLTSLQSRSRSPRESSAARSFGVSHRSSPYLCVSAYGASESVAQLDPQQQQQQQRDKEEEEEEWIELLLHYRDRENEGCRIRHALEDTAATDGQTPPVDTTATMTTTTTTAAVEATEERARANNTAALSWWATSSVMRDNDMPRETNRRHHHRDGVARSAVDASANADEARRSAGEHFRGGVARTNDDDNNSSSHSSSDRSRDSRSAEGVASFRPPLPSPPAALCAAMSAVVAGQTIARRVRQRVRWLRETSQLQFTASVAARLPSYAATREGSLR